MSSSKNLINLLISLRFLLFFTWGAHFTWFYRNIDSTPSYRATQDRREIQENKESLEDRLNRKQFWVTHWHLKLFGKKMNILDNSDIFSLNMN